MSPTRMLEIVKRAVDATPTPKSVDEMSERDRKYLATLARMHGLTLTEAFAALVKPGHYDEDVALQRIAEQARRAGK